MSLKKCDKCSRGGKIVYVHESEWEKHLKKHG